VAEAAGKIQLISVGIIDRAINNPVGEKYDMKQDRLCQGY